MKIGISGVFLNYPSTGLGQYVSHLISALTEVDCQNEYVILGPEPIERSSIYDRFPYEVHRVPGFLALSQDMKKRVWEQFTGPAAARKARVDLFHIPTFDLPFFPRTPCVVTIHDVISLRMQVYSAGVMKKAYRDVVARAAHKARLVITISQHAKQDIIDVLKLPAERIRVIYVAAGDEYHPIDDPAVLSAARARYGVGERYILYLGGLDQRKNVLQVVRAFAALYQQIGDPHLQLLIAGDPSKLSEPMYPDPRPVAAELGITGQILYRFIEQEDKAAIYSGASLFVFPSLYEGFGVTPLEAMSCGTPVICSNCTSLPEVTGDAAISLDPHDMQAWVQAMMRVLNDSMLHADLRARGLRRATRFTWHKTAAETIAVYEEAMMGSRK